MVGLIPEIVSRGMTTGKWLESTSTVPPDTAKLPQLKALNPITVPGTLCLTMHSRGTMYVCVLEREKQGKKLILVTLC